jgi:hypothetical protein
MKRILFQIILFGSLCFFESATMAQQAKAYETVKYIARIKSGVFHLDYANGISVPVRSGWSAPGKKHGYLPTERYT